MAEVDENKFTERDAALEQIATRLGVRAERGKRFAELTSLRVGGAIDWVLSPETEAQAAALVHEMDTGRNWLARAGLGQQHSRRRRRSPLRSFESQRIERRARV